MQCLRTILFGLLCLGQSLSAAGVPELPPLFAQAMVHLRNGRYQQALETTHALKNAYPDHPLSYLIAAEAYWGRIYCRTGHITSKEIWNVAEKESGPEDEAFNREVDGALRHSEQMRDGSEGLRVPGLGALYAGLARGTRARLYAMRDQRLKAAREGAKMRHELTEAVASDASLAPDAYLGLGSYNYYADVLSALLKFLRFFLGIPGGDRDEGLRQLQIAAQEARLGAAVAKYELAHIYGLRERRHGEAARLYAELAAEYPGNGMYWLAAAYQTERTGNKAAAIEQLQKAFQAAGRMDAACRERIGQATREALQRLGAQPSHAD